MQKYSSSASRVLNPALGPYPLAKKIINQSLGQTFAGVFVLLLLGVAPVAITIFEGNFSNDNLKVDNLHDFGAWNLFPASVAAYLAIALYFKRLAKAITTLHERKAILYEEAEFSRLIEDCNQIYRKRWVSFFQS